MFHTVSKTLYPTIREITEKIIKVLLSIKCAYALEPHQIQGLDTVKILPVMQVKSSFTCQSTTTNWSLFYQIGNHSGW